MRIRSGQVDRSEIFAAAAPVTLFPPICPRCHSASGRMIIPESPEVETYQCQACHHQWSQPALRVHTRSEAEPRHWWDRIAERLNRTKESDPQ